MSSVDLDSVLERIQAVPTAERAVIEAAEKWVEGEGHLGWHPNATIELALAVLRLREARGK